MILASNLAVSVLSGISFLNPYGGAQLLHGASKLYIYMYRVFQGKTETEGVKDNVEKEGKTVIR